MAIIKRKVSPRQKMINLMYVVLMAMLALNISTEVLTGFSIVEESLNRTTNNSSMENNMIYGELSQMMKNNPEKVREWFEMATAVRNSSDSLYNYAQDLKVMIVKEADGDDGNPLDIKNKDDLEAAEQVMLSPTSGQGKKLYEAINNYRRNILKFVTDPVQRKIIASNLSTQVPKNSLGKSWEEYMFESMPTAAAVTLLSKLQSDVRYAEGEVLHTLVANIGLKDVRVNELKAFVVPNQLRLYPGETFTANMFMAAIDTTQRPEVYVNGQKIQGNTYSVKPTSAGKHSISGYILMRDVAGNVLRRDFRQDYFVIGGSKPDNFIAEPTPEAGTVAADLMNVLYAGFDNPVSISIPNAAPGQLSASASGGSLRQTSPGHYIARPSAIGQPMTINVTAKGRSVGQYTFRVRKLPDPTAYIAAGSDRFKGGVLAKGSLLGAAGIHAAIDDGLLDIPFRVLSFTAVFHDNMGNAVPIASNGANFSQAQKEQFRHMARNHRVYITNISAIGPDNLTRRLPGAMEIIVR